MLMGGVVVYKVLGLASSKTRLVGALMGVNGGVMRGVEGIQGAGIGKQ